MDFKKIIDKCKKQDRAAQKRLYNLYLKKMMYVAFRYTNDLHGSKDIVQESMFRFFRSVDRLDFENKAALDAYIRNITVNESLRWVNKRKNIYQLDMIPESNNMARNHGEMNMQFDSLLNDVCSLPLKYRTVFNLFVIEGYTHREISEKLNIQESSSRSQLTRARSMLQKVLIKRNNHVERI